MRTGIRVLVIATAFTPLPAYAQTSAHDQQLARENFRQADENGDGKLDQKEFRAFIDANAQDDIGRAKMVRRFGAYDTAFGRADANGDGQVTPQELAAARKN